MLSVKVSLRGEEFADRSFSEQVKRQGHLFIPTLLLEGKHKVEVLHNGDLAICGLLIMNFEAKSAEEGPLKATDLEGRVLFTMGFGKFIPRERPR